MADNRLDLVAAALRNKFLSFAQTDTGRVRDHNEDSIGSDLETGLFVLADGKIVEHGPPQQVLDHPQMPRTQRFLGQVLRSRPAPVWLPLRPG